MPRTPSKFTQADLFRAVRAAKIVDYRVRLTEAGDIILEPAAASPVDDTPMPALAARPEIVL